MDGTILDNMRFHTEAWMRSLDELGLQRRNPLDWERQTSGTPNHEIFREILELDLDDAGIAYWVERKEELYREVAGPFLAELDGFSEFLRDARACGVLLGLATGAGPANIEFNLRALQLADAFDVLVGAADVVRGKPDPEVFLTSAARLGVRPDQALVFEDAPKGIESAAAAGMMVVGVSTMLSEEEFWSFDNVRQVISNFEGLSASDLRLLRFPSHS